MSLALSLLNLLTLVGVGVILWFVFRLSGDLEAVRKELNRRQGITRVVVPVLADHGHRKASLGKGYFALWRWDHGKWSLVMGIVPPGADPGQPPPERGKCTGETRKVWVKC